MGHDGWGDQLQRAESVDSSTWPNIRQARGTHWPARDALANGATQQQRRRARAGGVPGQVPQTRRPAAVASQSSLLMLTPAVIAVAERSAASWRAPVARTAL